MMYVIIVSPQPSGHSKKGAIMLPVLDDVTSPHHTAGVIVVTFLQRLYIKKSSFGMIS